VYVDIINPETPDLIEPMVRKALSIGYYKVGVITEDVAVTQTIGDKNVFWVYTLRLDDLTTKGRRARNKVDLIIATTKDLGETRKATMSKLVDGVMVSYNSRRPKFDYVCAKQLKRNEGALLIPVKRIILNMRERPQIISNIELEVKIALRAGIYPVIASFATSTYEIVPPRLLISFGEFFLGMTRYQAKLSLKDFPIYMLSSERIAKIKGVSRP